MNYWKNAEQTNGRLAMLGFSIAIINYGFTGFIIPGFINEIQITIHNSNRGQTNDSRSRKI
ncbi:MAG: hypothetical protein CM15mV13_1440 [uncultured marine virus]|nr:MAG: hypothetical protein CM15mV13_1440 [uncultured marine virus]